MKLNYTYLAIAAIVLLLACVLSHLAFAASWTTTRGDFRAVHIATVSNNDAATDQLTVGYCSDVQINWNTPAAATTVTAVAGFGPSLSVSSTPVSSATVGASPTIVPQGAEAIQITVSDIVSGGEVKAAVTEHFFKSCDRDF